MAEGVRKDEEFSGTKPVEERHRIDEGRLDGWMRDHVEGYAGPLTVLQFKGGQSNPTYRLDTPHHSYVMRRKPFGKLLPSAHAVDREYRVITALAHAGLPVPRSRVLCMDERIIGTAFYIMDFVDGRVFWDQSLPGMTKAARASERDDRPLTDRALKQMARELLLAQSSDWAFLIKTGTAKHYATKRVTDHLLRFNRLYDDFVGGNVDEAFLANCEWRDNLFPDVNWRHYV